MNNKSKTMKNGKTTTIKAAAKKAVSKKKPAAKKPVEKIISETSWNKEVEVTETKVVKKVKDVGEIPTGTYYTAEVDGVQIAGVVYNRSKNASNQFDIFGNKETDDEERVLLFLNNVVGDTIPEDVPDFGFTHAIDYDNTYEVTIDEATLRFPNPPEGFELPEIPEKIAGYYPRITRGKVKFGCQEVTNEQIENLYNMLEY